MRSKIACFTLAASLLPTSAFAQTAKEENDGVVREINRGLYLKSGIGATPYFQSNSVGGSLLSPVMTVDLSIGNDIVDKERLSMAVEAQVSQQLHDGPKAEVVGLEAPIVQGDVHVFALTATYEVSGYLTRRFGLGVRGGGGVSIIPLLMKDPFYTDQIVAQWGGVPASAHEGVQPTIRAGGTIEYYTKLSHFSVGADIDALIVVGSLGFGLSPTGYLKYTFSAQGTAPRPASGPRQRGIRPSAVRARSLNADGSPAPSVRLMEQAHPRRVGRSAATR